MKVEPSADMREVAGRVYQQYQAFVDAGFDQETAMILTLIWFQGVMK